MRRLDESTTGTELAELPAIASAISLMLLSGLTVGLAPDMTSPTDREPLCGLSDRSRSRSCCGRSEIVGLETRAVFTGCTRIWVVSERTAASSSTFRGRFVGLTSDTKRLSSRFFNVFLSSRALDTPRFLTEALLSSQTTSPPVPPDRPMEEGSGRRGAALSSRFCD
jgi:hypothetical protein